MSIYTRTGDKGKTSLFNGQRVSKSDLRIDIYGTIDELNSAMGVVLAEMQNAKCKIKNAKLKSEITLIQNDLFEINSNFVNPQVKDLSKRIKEFENLIDQMAAQMPKLNNFILPGGGKTGAILHLTRTVCRRLERKVVSLSNKEKVDENVIIYFNRLSDLLFTMARFANFREKKEEITWIK
jgi:cob(I)alamin adenosyltransferase